ncbi:MAG: hypothetical protein LBM16_02640 [Clostridiales bacterium]|jgi:hypothetical protein|nr:hypothetical protein [Clostridiales bacterium]
MTNQTVSAQSCGCAHSGGLDITMILMIILMMNSGSLGGENPIMLILLLTLLR